MAGIRADISLDVNTSQVKRSLDKATSEINRVMKSVGGKEISFNVNGRSFTQPLGRITASANEFTKSLEASNARVIAFGASVGIINGISDAFKGLVRETIAFEKTLTDINVVLGASNAQLEKFGKGIFDVARNTSQGFNIAAEAALEFSRQGLSMEEVLSRTNDALILTRLTGLNAGDSVSGLTAAVNAFGSAGLTTTDIIDKLAAVDVKFAVSSEDLINALERTGAVAIDAGVGIDSLIGLVTALQQTTARGGSVIGNGLKTIFTRIQRPQSLNQLESMGIAVKNLGGEILGADKILLNMAKSFDGLSQSQQSNLVQFSAGIFQANVFRAALRDLAKEQSIQAEATKISASAAGEAADKNEILNKTMAAMASQTATSIKELAEVMGKLMLTPEIGDFLNFVKDSVDGIKNMLGGGEEEGSAFAKGLVRGIGNVLTGPAAIAFGAIFIKLFVNISKFASSSLKDVLGIVSQKEKIRQMEESILQVLSENLNIQQGLNNLEGDRQAQEQFILGIIEKQNQAMRQQAALAAQLAKPLIRSGVNPDFSKKASAGLIPEEKSQERKGAAKGGYSAGGVDSMNVPGIGKVVYNKAETVKQFPGMKQPAIMPPEKSRAGSKYKSKFVDRHGFDPYAYGGFIPNYALEARRVGNTNILRLPKAKMMVETSASEKKAGDALPSKVTGWKTLEARISNLRTDGMARHGSSLDALESLGIDIIQRPFYFTNIDSQAKAARAANRAQRKVPKKGFLIDSKGRKITKSKIGGDAFEKNLLKSKHQKVLSDKGYISTGGLHRATVDFISKGRLPVEAKHGSSDFQKNNLIAKSLRLTGDKYIEEFLRKHGKEGSAASMAEQKMKESMSILEWNKIKPSEEAVALYRLSHGLIPNFAKNKVQDVKSIANIIDGDSIEADISIGTQRVDHRLHGVDAVEKDQSYGTRATSIAKEFYDNKRGKKRLKNFRVPDGKAAYGRGLFKDIELAKSLVQKGYGVPDAGYLNKRDYFEYQKIVEKAKNKGVGIWNHKVNGEYNHPKAQFYEHQQAAISGKKWKDVNVRNTRFDRANEKHKGYADGGKKFQKRIPNFADLRTRQQKIQDVLRDPANKGIKFKGANLGTMSIKSKNMFHQMFLESYVNKGLKSDYDMLVEMGYDPKEIQSARKHKQKGGRVNIMSHGFVPNFVYKSKMLTDRETGTTLQYKNMSPGYAEIVNSQRDPSIDKKGGAFRNFNTLINKYDSVGSGMLVPQRNGKGPTAWARLLHMFPQAKNRVQSGLQTRGQLTIDSGHDNSEIHFDSFVQLKKKLKKFIGGDKIYEDYIFDIFGGVVDRDEATLLENLTTRKVKGKGDLAAGFVSGGYVPNFANPLSEAIKREYGAGVPKSQIRIERDDSLMSRANPMGLAITNTRDEPMGVKQGIRRAKQMGIDPKNHGASEGFVPNFIDLPKTRVTYVDDKMNKATSAKYIPTESDLGNNKAVKENSDAIKENTKNTRASTDAMGGGLMKLFALQAAISTVNGPLEEMAKNGNGVSKVFGELGLASSNVIASMVQSNMLLGELSSSFGIKRSRSSSLIGEGSIFSKKGRAQAGGSIGSITKGGKAAALSLVPKKMGGAGFGALTKGLGMVTKGLLRFTPIIGQLYTGFTILDEGLKFFTGEGVFDRFKSEAEKSADRLEKLAASAETAKNALQTTEDLSQQSEQISKLEALGHRRTLKQDKELNNLRISQIELTAKQSKSIQELDTSNINSKNLIEDVNKLKTGETQSLKESIEILGRLNRERSRQESSEKITGILAKNLEGKELNQKVFQTNHGNIKASDNFVMGLVQTTRAAIEGIESEQVLNKDIIPFLKNAGIGQAQIKFSRFQEQSKGDNAERDRLVQEEIKRLNSLKGSALLDFAEKQGVEDPTKAVANILRDSQVKSLGKQGKDQQNRIKQTQANQKFIKETNELLFNAQDKIKTDKMLLQTGIQASKTEKELLNIKNKILSENNAISKQAEIEKNFNAQRINILNDSKQKRKDLSGEFNLKLISKFNSDLKKSDIVNTLLGNIKSGKTKTESVKLNELVKKFGPSLGKDANYQLKEFTKIFTESSIKEKIQILESGIESSGDVTGENVIKLKDLLNSYTRSKVLLEKDEDNQLLLNRQKEIQALIASKTVAGAKDLQDLLAKGLPFAQAQITNMQGMAATLKVTNDFAEKGLRSVIESQALQDAAMETQREKNITEAQSSSQALAALKAQQTILRDTYAYKTIIKNKVETEFINADLANDESNEKLRQLSDQKVRSKLVRDQLQKELTDLKISNMLAKEKLNQLLSTEKMDELVNLQVDIQSTSTSQASLIAAKQALILTGTSKQAELIKEANDLQEMSNQFTEASNALRKAQMSDDNLKAGVKSAMVSEKANSFFNLRQAGQKAIIDPNPKNVLEYAQALKSTNELFRNGSQAMDTLRVKMAEINVAADNLSSDLVGIGVDSAKSGIKQMFKDIASGAKSSGEAFQDMALGIAEKVLDRVMDHNIDNIVKNLTFAFTGEDGTLSEDKMNENLGNLAGKVQDLNDPLREVKNQLQTNVDALTKNTIALNSKSLSGISSLGLKPMDFSSPSSGGGEFTNGVSNFSSIGADGGANENYIPASPDVESRLAKLDAPWEGYYFGGKIQKFQKGGLVKGPGGVDNVPAMLTAGEYVIPKETVQKFSAGGIAELNNEKSKNFFVRGAQGVTEMLVMNSIVKSMSKKKNQTLENPPTFDKKKLQNLELGSDINLSRGDPRLSGRFMAKDPVMREYSDYLIEKSAFEAAKKNQKVARKKQTIGSIMSVVGSAALSYASSKVAPLFKAAMGAGKQAFQSAKEYSMTRAATGRDFTGEVNSGPLKLGSDNDPSNVAGSINIANANALRAYHAPVNPSASSLNSSTPSSFGGFSDSSSFGSSDTYDMPDSSFSDSLTYQSGGKVPAMLTAGEGFIPSSVAQKIGYNNLNHMNQTGDLPIIQGKGGIDNVGPVSLNEGDFIIRKSSTDKLLRTNPNTMRFAMQNPEGFKKGEYGYYEGGIVGTKPSSSYPSISSSSGSGSSAVNLSRSESMTASQPGQALSSAQAGAVTNNINVNVKIDQAGSESVTSEGGSQSYEKERELSLKIKSAVIDVIRNEKRIGGELS